MLAAKAKGAIVNIASVLGFGVSKGTIAYATAKAGVVQMTKALGLELAFNGVRVNAIAPGWFVTDINREYLASEQGSKLTRDIPVGRFGQDGDLDGALLAAGVGRRRLHGRHHRGGRRRPDGGAAGLMLSVGAMARGWRPGSRGCASARILVRPCPAIIASTNTMTSGDRLARFSSAGPGHRPTRPQPMPNSTEPTTSGRSMSVRVGHWMRAASSGRWRRRASA